MCALFCRFGSAKSPCADGAVACGVWRVDASFAVCTYSHFSACLGMSIPLHFAFSLLFRAFIVLIVQQRAVGEGNGVPVYGGVIDKRLLSPPFFLCSFCSFVVSNVYDFRPLSNHPLWYFSLPFFPFFYGLSLHNGTDTTTSTHTYVCTAILYFFL